jgi:hypothetical protein
MSMQDSLLEKSFLAGSVKLCREIYVLPSGDAGYPADLAAQAGLEAEYRD